MDYLYTYTVYMFIFSSVSVLNVTLLALLFLQLSGTVTIPFWQWFLTRFGKKTAVYVGLSVSDDLIDVFCLI